jgi:uncharacterized protein (DUF1697 family)
METYIALFRGINVGGNNPLPMKGLVALLESLHCQDVKTYIQSGNAVFRHESDDITALSNRISAGIKKSYGFEPKVLVLKVAELERAIALNPFKEAESDPKTLHLYFLASAPAKPDLDTLERMKADSEEFVLKDNVFYLHAPDGIGRSKLASQAERALGVSATARNWRTVTQIMDIAKQCGQLSHAKPCK